MPGAKVGPLFRCLLIEQMKKLRDGDRFYYENPSIFKPEQLAQIKQTNLGRVLCDNGDNITRATDDVFLLPARQGGYKECTELPMISLRVWTDCSDCSQRSAYNLDITKLPRRSRQRRDLKAMGDNSDNGNSIDDVRLNVDNDYSDMNEERIEGLEQLIESFQKTLKRMRREIRKLKETNDELSRSINMTYYQAETADKDKSAAKPSKHHYQCVDKKGINRLNNEIWMEDDCTNCLCQHHQIDCTTEKCPDEIPKCSEGFVFAKKLSQCCPTCIEQKPSLDETTITSNVTSSR